MTILVSLWSNDDALLAPLRARFPSHEFEAQPFFGRFAREFGLPEEDISEEARAAWARAECVLALDVPAPASAMAPALRWVQTTRAGIEHLGDLDLPEHVVVTNAAGVAAAPIAEFAIGRLLQVWKSFRAIDEAQAAHEWRPALGSTLAGRTLAVVGLGAIGTEVALRARAFGMTVIGVRRSYVPGQRHDAVDELRGPGDLFEVLARCDAVVACAPATPDTENLFDAATFAAMKPGAIFCNVGRGSLVDERALVAKLESGHLGAAVLDVVRVEPLPADDPLWAAPNLYLSPHCSAAQDRYLDALLALFGDNLERYLRGEAMRNVIDRVAGY